jgi:hypothetical protein
LLREGKIAHRWTFNSRFIAIEDPDAAQRFTLDYRLNPQLSVGLEHTPSRQEFLPRASWFVVGQRGSVPSLVVGFASDRLTTPRGSAVFLTATRTEANSPIVPFVSVKYATEKDRFYFPAGFNVSLDEGWVFQTLYDGSHTHFVLTRTAGGATLSALLARHRYPGLQVGFGF